MELESYHDLSSDTTEEKKFFVKYSEKLEQVKDVLVKMGQDSLESLVVDILNHHYLAPKDHHNHLYKASHGFDLLLRQHGYQVHAEEYFQFKDGGVSDTKASHLSMEEEDILHEAAIFSSQHLKANLIWREDEQLAAMVKNYPQQKAAAGNTWQNLLQELDSFESAVLESLHKHETLQVVKWWKALGLSNEMKSLRDQPEKWHVWSMAILKGLTWSKHRILLTKPIYLVYAVDDIFDLYGSIDQLTLFTQAINRWEICGVEKLPNYMKICFMAIQDTTREISRMVSEEYGWDPAEFLKEEWGNLFNAFLKEAKWFTSGKLAKRDEYLENGVISSGVPMVLSHLYVIMGNSFNQQTEIDLINHPRGLTYSVAKILRLLDDLGTAKDEEQEGYDGSYLECYMKEENVDSLEAAREHVMGMVSNTWENLNKHVLSSTSPFSASFREACLNAARMVPAMYNYDSNHRLPLLEQHVKSIFQDTTFTKSILR